MEEQTVSKVKNNLAIPIAIVLAGALIAGAIFISNKKAEQEAQRPQVQKANVTVPPVTAADHILGNPNAEIVIVEYSDFECPYCQEFNTVMKSIMDKYGKKGEIAWVHRHYWAPRKLQNGQPFHPLAGEAAEASECVAELGGNEKFWAFNDNIFANINTQAEKLTRLADIAVEVGVEESAFTSCLGSNKYASKVQSEYDIAKEIGVTGTPTSFIMTKDGTYPISGFIPLADMEMILEDIL